MKTFVVTRDAGAPKARVDWPLDLKPTVSARTTVSALNLAPTSQALVSFDTTRGAVSSKVNVTAAGLDPGRPVTLDWATVVGNRVNCTGTCWSFVTVPLAVGVAGADGSLRTNFSVPDGLGGWHVVRVLQGTDVKTQTPYFVERSVIDVPRVVKEGRPFQVHLKGVGWTQLDNTVAVTYDNGYVGYGCGFNSNGDVVLNLVATGGARHASDRHLPAALSLSARLRLSTTRSDPVPVVRSGLPRARARVPAARVQAGDQGRLLAGSWRGEGLRPFPSAYPRDAARKTPSRCSESAPRSA